MGPAHLGGLVLAARAALRTQYDALHRMVLDLARRDPICRRLMTAPGVGPVVALTYRTVIDNSIDLDQVYPGQEPKLHFLAFPARETPEFDGRAFLPRLCRITPVEGQHLRWGPLRP